ncbi:unnamed protein product, partial [Ilex paraguariensis]
MSAYFDPFLSITGVFWLLTILELGAGVELIGIVSEPKPRVRSNSTSIESLSTG